MGKCIADNCNSRSDRNADEISFFRFPKAMKLEWVRAIKKNDWAPSKCSVICSLHFEEKFIISNKNGIRNLTKDAVPTLNLPKILSLDKETQTQGELNVKSDPDEQQPLTSSRLTSESSRPTSQSFFSDIGSPSTSNFNLYDDLTVISDEDSPETKKLKLAVRHLSFLSEKRKKAIKILNQSKRRSKKKIQTLTNILNNLKKKS